MAENLFVPLLEKDRVEARLSLIESGIRNNSIKYIKNEQKEDIEARIEKLRQAERKFFDMFSIPGNTTQERTVALNNRIKQSGISITKMNGQIIQEEILDVCSSSYNEALLKYLREEIFTEDIVMQEAAIQQSDDWRKGLIALLNREIQASTGKKGKLHTDTKGLSASGDYSKLLAKQLTARARAVIEQKVKKHIKDHPSNIDALPAYDFILKEKEIEISGMDWRGKIKGLTPTQARTLLSKDELDEINHKIVSLILNYAEGADKRRLRNVIETFLLHNDRGGEYAFFVGNNNKAITGLLGEIQGLYYICSLFNVTSWSEIQGKIDGHTLNWLADTYGATSKKLSIDILLDEIGIQVKNTTRDITDDFYSQVSFTESGLTLSKLMASMGVQDDNFASLISSLFQTRMFNVEYQYKDDTYIQAPNDEFAPTRERMEELVQLTEKMFALWMEAAMHIGVNNTVKSAMKDNVNAIYFVNGVFYGASEILAQLFRAVFEGASTGFSIHASMPTSGLNIVGYLNGYSRKTRKQSMYGSGKNTDVDLKINTSFNFMSLTAFT